MDMGRWTPPHLAPRSEDYMHDMRDIEALTEKCSNCGKAISDTEYVTNWTVCAVCFDEDYTRYLNTQRNRAERGRPGRRPPPRQRNK